MKSEGGLKELQRLAMAKKRKQYPSVPDAALPQERHNDTTSGGLTKAILRWLDLHNHKAWRQSSEGRYRPGKQYTDVIGRVRLMKGEYLPGTHSGHGDIAAIIQGRFITWEVKIRKDRQSVKQKAFQEEVEQSGGKYFIVRSFDEFISQYNSITKTETQWQA